VDLLDVGSMRRALYRDTIRAGEAMATFDWHKDRTDADVHQIDDVGAPPVDLARVRAYRLGRVRTQMAQRDIAACILVDPVNIRYATGARNMQVFHMRNPSRYLFLPVEGPVVLFEFTGAGHLAADLETIDEVRPALTASFVAAGPHIADRELLWAKEAAALVRDVCDTGVTVGLERVNAGAAAALAREGFRIVDAQEPMERARAVKSAEELELIRTSLSATEAGVAALRDGLRPGMTENEVWSILHAAVIAGGGDYVETRLLTSGIKTNPWFQEAGDRRIGANELVALDTDVVGCHGYYADFSRTFHSGPGAPTAEQRRLYRTAHEQVMHNVGILEAGMTFREYAERAWMMPDEFVANRYYLSAHGVGMTGEYPYLYHHMDFPDAGYDGVIEPMMTLCVESYIGAEDGAEGVKLEEQILVTEDGIEVLSRFPFEDELIR
jgi:Xaa-Pro dipeptidase